MTITISGQHIDSSNALQQHVEEKLEITFEKYFGDATQCNISFSKDGHLFRCSISCIISHGIDMQAEGSAGDAYAAFDEAHEHLEKRLRRHKKRIRDNHNRKDAIKNIEAMQYIVPGEGDEVEDNDNPIIIAETATLIPTISVSEAVMRLDLSGQNAMMFYNSKTNNINMVHRREDGNIGWIDPEQTAGQSAA